MSVDAAQVAAQSAAASTAGSPRSTQRRFTSHSVTPRSAWAWTWPKLVAIGLVVGVWQLLVSLNWRPDYVLPGPATVASDFWDLISTGRLWGSFQTTLGRALTGYALALVVGTAIGIAVVQWRVIRMGVASLVAGLQTMPSIAWFPLAILLFGLDEKAILFVIVLGAAPSIASGVITGIDEVPPPLLRAGKMIGARGVSRYRYVVLPAAMPSYLQGMKQGWAFSWRSLLAGELLVSVAGVTSIGGDLQLARQFGHPPRVISLMIVILLIGMVVDGIFGFCTKRIRDNRGLTGMA